MREWVVWMWPNSYVGQWSWLKLIIYSIPLHLSLVNKSNIHQTIVTDTAIYQIQHKVLGETDTWTEEGESLSGTGITGSNNTTMSGTKITVTSEWSRAQKRTSLVCPDGGSEKVSHTKRHFSWSWTIRREKGTESSRHNVCFKGGRTPNNLKCRPYWTAYWLTSMRKCTCWNHLRIMSIGHQKDGGFCTYRREMASDPHVGP